MTVCTSEVSAASWLLCRTGLRLCALPLGQVVETMRPLPIERLISGPAFVRGLSIIRGLPVPVLDLGSMFGEPETSAQRFVTTKVADRLVALLVGDVVGVRAIGADFHNELPPLVQDAAGDIVLAIGMLDAELLLFLQTVRMVPQTVLDELDQALTVS